MYCPRPISNGMKILAIETSCDETAIAIAEFSGSKNRPKIKVLSNIISSQVKLHAEYGGVVPNLAKREHQRNLVPVLLQALEESGLRGKRKSDFPREVGLPKISAILEREPELFRQVTKKLLLLRPPKIDAITVTYGPGLAPALWVGVNFAKALAYLWEKPLIPVNHMAGHLYSAFLQKSGIESYQLLVTSYPAIALLVSGGHTELVLTRGHGKFRILGETLDDAAGEAFDKVARILGFGYPGGPEISRLASYAVAPRKIKLPRPMLNTKDYNFSFSGLKTAAFYLVRDFGPQKTKKLRPLIAKEFQDAVVEVLVKKTFRAAKEYKVKTVLLGGGVAANKKLREELKKALQKELPEAECWMPEPALAGDNALMIALAAYFAGKKKAPNRIGANANLKLC